MKRGARLRKSILGPALALGLCAPALACTIPVFRFALDRWDVDKFRLIMPASWATQPDMVRLMIPLRGNGQANIRIEDSQDASATQARLLFPIHDTEVWSGKVDATTLPALLDSPARRELLARILDGHSAVWVVCTRDADKAEADRVEKRLRYLEQVAQLPVQDPNDPDSQLGPGPPLKLKFSVLRVSLDDPAERLFAAMVAGPRQQDFIKDGTAFAGPVFAKGRVLGSWPLAELDDTAIEDASLFLIGRCSCRIKNENPGWDVVLKTEWDRSLVKAGERPAADEAASGEPPSGTAADSKDGNELPEPREPTAVSESASPAPPTQHAEPLRPTETFVATAAVPEPAPNPSPVHGTSPRAAFPELLLSRVGLTGGACAILLAAALMLWFKR